jgi:hypothetical protein
MASVAVRSKQETLTNNNKIKNMKKQTYSAPAIEAIPLVLENALNFGQGSTGGPGNPEIEIPDGGSQASPVYGNGVLFSKTLGDDIDLE